MDVDSLAARVGLDLRLYDDGYLMGTSRPRLVRDGLVDERLPGPVYHAIHDEAFRFRAAPASIGSFRYMVGYQALVDEAGTPQLVVGVPTLAQQEQVAEEQARTLAYLFGALLVLVVVVMLTAVVLANALAQPIARLREGLEAVGEGRFVPRVIQADQAAEGGGGLRSLRMRAAQGGIALAQERRRRGDLDATRCRPGCRERLRAGAGESDLVDAAAGETLLSGVVPINANDEYGYGRVITTLGWAGGRVASHTGSNTVNHSVAWVAPARDFALLAVTNAGDLQGGRSYAALDALIGRMLGYYQSSR